jgi:hypothetical protein
MTKTIGALFLAFSAHSVAAAEISESDAGTYYSKGRDGTPRYFVLAMLDGKWVWKDKDPGGPISKIQCLSGCEYKATSEAENQTLIPSVQRQFQDLACIKNTSFAFCRLSQKQLPPCGPGVSGPCLIKPPPKPSRPMYLMFALFGGKPALIPLWRADPQ